MLELIIFAHVCSMNILDYRSEVLENYIELQLDQ